MEKKNYIITVLTFNESGHLIGNDKTKMVQRYDNNVLSHAVHGRVIYHMSEGHRAKQLTNKTIEVYDRETRTITYEQIETREV